MATEQQFASYRDRVKTFSEQLNEPDWMLNKRLDALELADELAEPVIERLRYNRWPLWDVPVLDAEDGVTDIDVDEYVDTPSKAMRVVQAGNQSVREQVPAHLAKQGVIFTDIRTALIDHPEKVKEAYQTAVQSDRDKAAAFNAAFMNSGVFLYIPKNVVIEDPVEAIFIQDALRADAYVKHVIIYADVNAQVNYVERWLTAGNEKTSANIIVEVIAKDGARINYSSVDLLGENTTAYFNRVGHVLRDATIDWALGVMNDGNVIADLDTHLIGDGSESDLKAVGLSWGRQTQVVDSNVVNFGSNSVGNIFQHGVILDRATLTFNGIGKIHKNAKNADAQQESRVLMLSEKARGDANPILLIDEFEVTAGHAASVGRIDPTELYYLMSRGIPKEEAQRLAIRGFLGNVISNIPLKSIRDELVNVIERKLSSR
ncbi:Fe-S cluster assembly protein SufD [Dolosigranulum pigrum]|uniref:Fe-S cluster assembly protein SufD n=1 Tax=Dolosigranulum pigrum TaxID=29394 RepID=UPI000DC023A7|nr:Fe-S cluster assembly protein SufD [Dolosigranulum pigrum]QTJ36801.1 Fe-S cluster assembly protein SufD [Dolosigranulum pigrum]QTJ58938.1 Fe-S cluster assembly protein SufD [Dolosigranulum pigrum]RAN66029.1 Fe-S cluster assembly protein SufD [Dolosigranulum pigrum]